MDGGPWGDVWEVLRDRDTRAAVAATFDAWEADVQADRIDRVTALWLRLAAEPPSRDPVARVAQYLWLQARSAGTIPVWWNPERDRWESPSGSRVGTSALAPRSDGDLGRQAGSRKVGAAHQKRPKGDGPSVPASTRRPACGPGPAYQASSGVEAVHQRGVGRQKSPGCRGVMAPGTIARRIRALDAVPWDRVDVLRGRVEEVEPIPGSAVYFDPPYLHAPRYALLFPRSEVLAVATRHAAARCQVVVSEGEPLPLPGWRSSRLPGSVREWITCSWGGAMAEQLTLAEVA